MTPQVLSFDDALADALAERDQALEQVNRNADEWAKATVDQAILSLAAIRPTSANDFRDKLPEIGNRALIGARFRSLLMQKRLVRVGEVTSTDPGTHAKKIGEYVTPELLGRTVVNRVAAELAIARYTDADGGKR